MYETIPYTYHQYLKAVWRGTRIHVNATEFPFQRDEAHFSEATYFDELTEIGDVTATMPQGVPLPIREDLEGQEP